VFCSWWTLRSFTDKLAMCVKNKSFIVPSAPKISSIVLNVVPYICCNSIVKFIYFSTFSFKTFLSVTHATSIRNVCFSSLLTRTKSGCCADINWSLKLYNCSSLALAQDYASTNLLIIQVPHKLQWTAGIVASKVHSLCHCWTPSHNVFNTLWE